MTLLTLILSLLYIYGYFQSSIRATIFSSNDCMVTAYFGFLSSHFIWLGFYLGDGVHFGMGGLLTFLSFFFFSPSFPFLAIFNHSVRTDYLVFLRSFTITAI
jgi:hypothetical protein